MNEATKTTEWLKIMRKKHGGSFIWKIPDDSNREKPIDVLAMIDGLFYAIEFKYSKKELTMKQSLKLLQLNQMLTINKVSSNGGIGMLGVFYTDKLIFYIHTPNNGLKRSKIGPTIDDDVRDYGCSEEACRRDIRNKIIKTVYH